MVQGVNSARQAWKSLPYHKKGEDHVTWKKWKHSVREGKMRNKKHMSWDWEPLSSYEIWASTVPVYILAIWIALHTTARKGSKHCTLK